MAFIIAVSNLLSHVFNPWHLTWEKGKGQPAPAFGRAHWPTQELIKQKDTPVKMSGQRSEYFRRILLTVFLILIENSNSFFSSVPYAACILYKMWAQLQSVPLFSPSKENHPQLICMGSLRSQIFPTLSLTPPHPTQSILLYYSPSFPASIIRPKRTGSCFIHLYVTINQHKT